jgi:hypothetical protein
MAPLSRPLPSSFGRGNDEGRGDKFLLPLPRVGSIVIEPTAGLNDTISSRLGRARIFHSARAGSANQFGMSTIGPGMKVISQIFEG